MPRYSSVPSESLEGGSDVLDKVRLSRVILRAIGRYEVPSGEELVFTVVGKEASALASIDLSELGFTEREHLQSWVIAHPEIIGPNVMVVSFEFDQWATPNGSTPKDRLDVLGLDSDGRLVITELKRGMAPDTVDLQAIKYAAMASRMTDETLVNLFAEYRLKTMGEALTPEDALGEILAHAQDGLSTEALAKPRIVLLAEDFRAVTTSSVVWLSEQGLDITMKRYQAYRTAGGESVLTVSQYYPVADVSEFQIAPHLRSGRQKTDEDLPEVEWSTVDLKRILEKNFVVPIAILDLCSKTPDQFVGSGDAYTRAGVVQKAGMGRLAGFGYSVRTKFGRSNAPWRSQWAAGGLAQQYYAIDEATAERWRALRESAQRESHSH